MLFEAKYKSKYGEEIEILTPKQMLQRLPIATAHVKTGNTRKIYERKSGKLFILCISQRKLLKNYPIT